MLNGQEVEYLLGNGRELWQKLDAFGIAYLQRYKSKARLADYLSYATIIAGIVTAISTIPKYQQYTVYPAVLTAITAVISQVLSPQKGQRENWMTWRKIDALKTDLGSRCRGLYLAVDFAKEQTVFINFNRHFDVIVQTEIEVTLEHMAAAKRNIAAADIVPIAGPIPDAQDDEPIVEEQAATQDSSVIKMGRRVVPQ